MGIGSSTVVAAAVWAAEAATERDSDGRGSEQGKGQSKSSSIALHFGPFLFTQVHLTSLPWCVLVCHGLEWLLRIVLVLL